MTNANPTPTQQETLEPTLEELATQAATFLENVAQMHVDGRTARQASQIAFALRVTLRHDAGDVGPSDDYVRGWQEALAAAREFGVEAVYDLETRAAVAGQSLFPQGDWQHVQIKAGNPRVVAIQFETAEQATEFINTFAATASPTPAESFVQSAFAFLNTISGADICTDRTCIRCRIADVAFEVERRYVAAPAESVETCLDATVGDDALSVDEAVAFIRQHDAPAERTRVEGEQEQTMEDYELDRNLKHTCPKCGGLWKAVEDAEQCHGMKPCTKETNCAALSHFGDCKSMPTATSASDSARRAAKEIADLSYNRHRDDKIAQYTAIISRHLAAAPADNDAESSVCVCPITPSERCRIHAALVTKGGR